MSLATLTKSGRAAIVKALLSRPMHLAWGSGDAAWDSMDEGDLPSLLNCTALYSEIGRREVVSAGYVEPDENGDIVVPVTLNQDGTVTTARYRTSEDPTPYLHVKIRYAFEDAPTAVIRELGLFLDTEVAEGVPAGQQYLQVSEVQDPGILLAMQIVTPAINRSPSVRQTVEFVLPI